ncbi:MAG TPA: extracellular solute-binding protein [Candidatus Paceibacterota bacterium]|nr:extracellular solute-binding protein [Candidatus Paceibacterota bacterium]
MNFTRNQKILIAAMGGVVLILLLVFVGILPGLKKKETRKVAANLQFWGVYDSVAAYEGAINAFSRANPGVEIAYRGFSDPEEYESTLLNALAVGKGPDIFMVRNTDLLRDATKIAPVPVSKLSVLGLRNLFPQIVESDFAPDGREIFALPLSIDTLALIYNQDFFNEAAIVSPPKTWTELEMIVPKLLRKENGYIKKAAIALGGSLRSIGNAPDILSLLMLQSGTEMISRDYRSAAFASTDGEEAMNFYLKFADPRNTAYSWNDEMKKAREAFAAGEVAMILDYASALPAIRSRNTTLNVGVAEAPQPATAEKVITFGNYWGYAVSRQSRYVNTAWDFVLSLVTGENAKNYQVITGKPPALRALINQLLNDPSLSVFAKQSLVARAWPQVDYNKTSGFLSDAIESVLSGRASVRNALQEAEGKVTDLLIKRL